MSQSMNNNSTTRLQQFLAGRALLGLGIAALLAVCWFASSPRAAAAEKAKGQEISRVIAKEMTAAQKALQAGQWDEALKNLQAAETKSGLTAFDKKTIYNFEGFAHVKLNKLKDAQPEFEKALATGAASPEEVASMTRTLFGIAASTGQYQKTIDFGKQLVDAGSATPDNLAIIAQSYYQLKDCKDSIVWADKAIAASRKAGEAAPKENLYLFKLQCASDSGDTPAMDAVLMDLIKLNNKTTYWNTLLRIERQDERDDHNTLMIYRIMYNTNSMNADTDYIEMAQLLGDAALPGEAAAVLDKALAGGVIKDEHKERTNRLLNSLKTRADADRKGLPQEAAEADKSAAGELDVKLGEVYYGFGDYQKAIDAINKGLQKGQIKHQDEAYVYLGLANAQLKNYPDAKKAFQGLKTVPNISPRVLKLFELYSATLGMNG
jgi:tetratricopeptide (TPR) repeat protein